MDVSGSEHIEAVVKSYCNKTPINPQDSLLIKKQQKYETCWERREQSPSNDDCKKARMFCSLCLHQVHPAIPHVVPPIINPANGRIPFWCPSIQFQTWQSSALYTYNKGDADSQILGGPCKGNTVLFLFSQQLPRLCLRPLKAFLSWHATRHPSWAIASPSEHTE